MWLIIKLCIWVFSLLWNAQTVPGAHPEPINRHRGFFFCRGWSGRCVKLTAHLTVVQSLRMNGALLLLPVYTFTFRIETRLLFIRRQGSTFARECCRRHVVIVYPAVRTVCLQSCICCETWWNDCEMRQWEMSVVTHFNGKFCFLEILALL